MVERLLLAYCLHWDGPPLSPGRSPFTQGREAFRTSGSDEEPGRRQWCGGDSVMRPSEESRKARNRLGKIESAMRTRCFFRPRASTMTSPVGGNAGGRGRDEEDGAGDEGTGDDGRDGGGGGHGEGDTSGGESGEVMMRGQR